MKIYLIRAATRDNREIILTAFFSKRIADMRYKQWSTEQESDWDGQPHPPPYTHFFDRIWIEELEVDEANFIFQNNVLMPCAQ